jgi:hypothetical protein
MQNRNGQLQRITMAPEICHGKPVFRGLRYPAETILELLSSGMTELELKASSVLMLRFLIDSSKAVLLRSANPEWLYIHS